jgi:hypothetical protein
MALSTNDFMQMSPIFIAVFMLMTSMFNGDVKAFVWLGCAILGVVALIPISPRFTFKSPVTNCQSAPAVIDIFSKYPGLSVSTFFIVFTLMYLIWPMMQNNDWNYYVIVGFLGMLAMDTLIRLRNCTLKEGIVSGMVLGGLYSLLCFGIIRQAGGDKLLYYNTVSSNNIYCSRPKKQQFKCYVYKNGQIISTV